jgi:hypothetical protein
VKYEVIFGFGDVMIEKLAAHVELSGLVNFPSYCRLSTLCMQLNDR